MAKTYKIGTRTSPLALKQVEEILNALNDAGTSLKAEIVGIDTCGDKDKFTPISYIEGEDFFTKEIDQALLLGEIDFAVHSAKDVPFVLAEGFHIAALTESIDPYDVLVSRDGLKLDSLPFGARIGTSSIRRKEALKKFRPDFELVDIRGNIQERLKILETTSLNAIVIAAAGLIRLGLEERITEILPPHILEPHPLQGRLAVIARAEDSDLIEILSKIDSRETAVI
ncbi:MAG: hydroxymethylbilane synthase [Candidatus Omnitrophica bacterium]|nr:hydroxymethylbilane synthase [Candidatus Omnitrophota bacterium]